MSTTPFTQELESNANTLTAPVASNEAMETLTAQWYNAMITGLGLSNQQFQLYQGPNSMVKTSQDMWNLFNAVPPTSVNNYFDPNQANNFAQDYDLILSALITNPDTDFQNCMGDYYSKWQTYFANNDPKTWDAQGVSDLFNKWAIKNAPAKASCVSGLTKAFINPINIANNMFESAKGSYAWNRTIDGLQTALAGGASKSFTMSSNTQSSDVKHTWAGGGVSVIFDLFSFGGGGSYDNLSSKATSAGVEISAKFTKVTTFAAGPYAQADANNPILADYSPWYSSAALAKAYTTKDNTVWNNQVPTTWDTAFGTNGFLQRMASGIVVADGVEITMSSRTSYSSSEQTQIHAAAKFGFWPFFRASGGGGTTTSVTFDDNGVFTSVTKIALGNPQILGVIQSSMSSIF
jgi:hypothetical protein